MQTITSWDECNTVMERLGAVIRELNIIEMGVKEQVAAIQSAALQQASPLAEEQKALQEAIELFATEHREDLAGKKSKVLPAGDLGWKTSPASLDISDPERTLELIQSLGMKEYLREEPQIDKTALKKAEPEVLKKLGVELVRNEKFFIKPV